VDERQQCSGVEWLSGPLAGEQPAAAGVGDPVRVLPVRHELEQNVGECYGDWRGWLAEADEDLVAYNIIEGVIAVAAGLVAGSIALVGFGFGSWIEVAAAAAVLHRLRAEIRHGQVDETKEHRALRFIAITFFALAAYVTVEGIRDLATDSGRT
jgi:hypothetical protein